MASSLAAEEWPARNITMTATFPAGGPTDGISRVIANELSERLGRNVVVENKGGAGGTLGAMNVANSQPDGYSLLMTSSGPLSYYSTLYKSLKYKPTVDLVPIVVVGTIPQVIVASPKGPKSLKEFIAYAKANPGKVTIGDSGVGTTLHILAAMLAKEADIQILHVHYRGAANSLSDVMGGQIDAALSAFLPQFASMNSLGITSTERVSALPNVPTFLESGLPITSGLTVTLAAPAKTPPAIIAKLNGAVNDFLKSPAGREFSEKYAVQLFGGSPEEGAAFLVKDAARLEPVIKSANITAD
jgi:tripartite-type tricarboxylate transporter receptor subunit TctC